MTCLFDKTAGSSHYRVNPIDSFKNNLLLNCFMPLTKNAGFLGVLLEASCLKIIGLEKKYKFGLNNYFLFFLKINQVLLKAIFFLITFID